MAVTTVDGLGLEFGFGPGLGGMVSGFVVALDAGVEFAAAFVLNGDDVALRMPVGALGALVYLGAVDGDRFGDFHFYESNRST